MKWIYHIKKSWNQEGYSPAQQLLVRAIMKNEDEEQMVSNIIELNVFALDFYFNLPENPLDEPKYQQIYFEELEKKDYFIEELEKAEGEEEYLMLRAVLFLKAEKFNQEELLNHLNTCLSIWGYENAGFEEVDITGFAEMNPLLRMFSLDNVEKFEDRLGKDWWKKKDK